MQYKKIVLLLLVFNSFCSFSQENLIGTFYGGWARNKGDYIWIKNLGTEVRFLAVGDVNGDGYEDAFTANLGKLEVALSETYTNLAGRKVRHFGKKATWAGRFGVGKGNSVNNGQYLVGELNGDSKTDMATFDEKRGNWEFALSTGDEFEIISTTIEGFGTIGNQPHLKDVNGDKMADAIIFDSGTWKVRLNNGKSFDPERTFVTGFGSTLSQTFMADVNGDGKADAVYYEEGDVYVAVSDGLRFVSPSLWLSGIKATKVMLGDATGDNLEDVILFHLKDSAGKKSGKWEICKSNGQDSFEDPELWCIEHGSGDRRNRITKSTPVAHEFMVGYVQSRKESGNGVSAIAINKNYGYWQVLPPQSLLNGVTSPKWYNSWHTWNRATLPRIGEQYYGFDAEEDSFAIAEIIKELAKIEIDYVLLDQTNPWGVLLKSYQVFANEISKWNKVPGNRKVKYAICGKGWKPIGPEDVEESARRSIGDFVNHPVYGSSENYQFVDGKPLLVIYGGGERKDRLWKEYAGNKSFANRFTLKWMDGHLYPEGMDPDNKGDWYGWALVNGSYENAEQMVVQPGFFNHISFASRFKGGIEGDRYRRLFWDKVLLNKPDKVTIISLVGDHEQNDIYDMRIGDYPEEMGRTEHWSYPEMYWEMTRDYIQNYRLLKKGEIHQIAEYGRYEINNSKVTVNFTKQFSETPIVYGSIEGGTGRKRIRITNITSNSFDADMEGINIGLDKINWLAVLPGDWETPNGMKVSAHKKSGNVESNGQMMVLKTSEKKTAGSIWFEAGKTEFWSGRFCTALNVENSGKKELSFSLPRYFYDEILTLSYSLNCEVQPVVNSTSNTGGILSYSSVDVPRSDTINVISFDGGGGCLYGKSLKITPSISRNQNTKSSSGNSDVAGH